MVKVCILLLKSNYPFKVYVVEANSVSQAGKEVGYKFKKVIEENALSRFINEEDIEIAIKNGCFEIPFTDYSVIIMWPEKERE